MAEFDEKLNALLSDPNSMAQIMQLAQSLSGSNNKNSNPQEQAGPFNNAAYAPPQGGYSSQPSQQSGYPNFDAGQNGYAQQGYASPVSGFMQGANSLSSLLGSIDPKMIARMVPLLQELSSAQNNNSRALLYALRPYLKAERQEKIERALQLARVVHIGKKFISGWEA